MKGSAPANVSKKKESSDLPRAQLFVLRLLADQSRCWLLPHVNGAAMAIGRGHQASKAFAVGVLWRVEVEQ